MFYLVTHFCNILWLSWPLWNIRVTNDHGYVPLVVSTSRSFPRAWLITGFVSRLTRRVSLVEQELLPFRCTWVHSGISEFCVIRCLVLYVCFVDRCLYFCTFSFGHCVVCSYSIYGFRLPFGIFKPFLWSFLVDTNVQIIFIVCLYMWCRWRSNYQGSGWLNEVGSWIT
jgi:hypothetical protein